MCEISFHKIFVCSFFQALLKLEQAVRLEENQDRAARLESTCRALHQYDMDSKSEVRRFTYSSNKRFDDLAHGRRL
jgi:hypothetical protein